MHAAVRPGFLASGAALAALLLLSACGTPFRVIRYGYPDVQDYAIFPNDTVRKGGQPRPIPQSLGRSGLIDTIRLRHPASGRLLALPEYLAQTRTNAFLIVHNDTLVYEQYFGGYSRSTLHGTFSVSKSITSVVAGAAMAEFPELSEASAIAACIPELRGAHPDFEALSLRAVFAMKSGLSYSTYRRFWDLFCDNNMMYYTRDQKRYLSKSGFSHAPGTYRQYKAYDPILIAWAIEQAARTSFCDYFSRTIWGPVGAEYDALWSTDRPGGLVKASSSFACTAVDLAKIGLLYAHDGVCGGAQIVSASWIHTTTGAAQMRGKQPVLDTWWQPSHDYFWWFSTIEPVGDYYADGYKGQFLYINPGTRTVIVKFSEVPDELHDMPFRIIAESLAEMLPAAK